LKIIVERALIVPESNSLSRSELDSMRSFCSQEIRKKQKRKAKDSSEELREKWLQNILKQKAVNELLGKDAVASTSRQEESDLFALPSLPEKDEDSLESSE
jgi:hypothetical protein